MTRSTLRRTFQLNYAWIVSERLILFGVGEIQGMRSLLTRFPNRSDRLTASMAMNDDATIVLAH